MELKYIRSLGEKKLWENDNTFGLVELLDFSRANENEESRKETVCYVAGLCYGSEPKDLDKLYNRLKTESAGGPSSAFEFVREFTNPTIGRSFRNNPVMLTHEGRMGDDPLITLEGMASFMFNSLLTFRVKVPLFIARQIMRHRSFAYQEQSRRYQDEEKAPFEFWSTDEFDFDYSRSIEDYNDIIDNDYPAEIARVVIPQAAYTTMYMQGDLDAWINYFNLRLDLHTQKAHRELAIEMYSMIEEFVPKAFKHIENRVEINLGK